MKMLPPIKIDDAKLESWLSKRTSVLGVTTSSTVRDALALLMAKDKESKKK